jgi:hypothetical protein
MAMGMDCIGLFHFLAWEERRKYEGEETGKRKGEDHESKAKERKLLWLIDWLIEDWMYDRLGHLRTGQGRQEWFTAGPTVL